MPMCVHASLSLSRSVSLTPDRYTSTIGLSVTHIPLRRNNESMMDSEIFTTLDDNHNEHTIFSTDITQDPDGESRDGLPEIPVEVIMSKQKLQASQEQKELMMGFIQENPEMVTHSSTPESERDLWEVLTNKLNDLKPEKTQDNWKSIWYRWQTSVFKRSEEKLKCLDMKLKKFLKQLKSDSEGRMMTSSKKAKKRLSAEDIENILKDIEKERYSLHLEIDESQINILKFKSIVRTLESENISKHKRMKKLNERKVYLNNKRRKIQEAEMDSIEILEKQLFEIDKKLAKDES